MTAASPRAAARAGLAGLLLAALALSTLALTATAAPSVAPAPAVSRHVLGNGMRLLVREEASAGVVAVSLQVSGGTRLESPDTAGITHFLHRAMLRGAGRRTGEQLAEAAERLGGSVDASGDVDHAEVRGAALSRHWEALLSLVADVALRPALAPEDVERERRLILGQIQTRLDTPFPLALDTLLGELYGPHPYARPAAGRRESVSALGREALAAHHRALYRADRVVLAVSGRVERDRVRRAAERLFGDLPAGGVAPVPVPTRPETSHGRRVVARQGHQAQVFVGFLGPAVHEADYAAVKVLAAGLGGGMAGRLFVELREREGLAYSVGVLNPTRAGPSPIVAYMGTAPDNAERAEAGMLRELARVRSDGLTAEELERARAYVLGGLAMDRRTNARHAWYLAFFEGLGVGWDFPERYARAVQRLTLADVGRAAERYLQSPTTVVLAPR